MEYNMNETVRALIIYDNTGRVWGVFTDVEEVPAGLQSIIADIPASGVKEIYLDMTTTPPTPHIVPNDDINDELDNVQLALIELDERISALEG